MEYHEILPLRRAELEELLGSGNVRAINEALLSAAFHDCDWEWAQNQCLSFLSHSNRDVRSIAATCLGHIARIHRKLDIDIVLPQLYEAKSDQSIAAGVDDAIDDIKLFVRLQ